MNVLQILSMILAIVVVLFFIAGFIGMFVDLPPSGYDSELQEQEDEFDKWYDKQIKDKR